MIFCCCPNRDFLYGYVQFFSSYSNLTIGHGRFLGEPLIYDVSLFPIHSRLFAYSLSIPKMDFSDSSFSVPVDDVAFRSISSFVDSSCFPKGRFAFEHQKLFYEFNTNSGNYGFDVARSIVLEHVKNLFLENI